MPRPFWRAGHGKRDANLLAIYFFDNSVSTALVRSDDSGLMADSKRPTITPLRPTRNLVKFHLMSPPNFGSVSFEVSSLYSGVMPFPLTTTFDSIGNVTLYFSEQNLAI